MGYFDKFNKGRRFDVETDEWEFYKLGDMYENNGADYVYTACTFFFTQGNFGKQPVVGITEEVLLNLPGHLNEVVGEIIADDEAVEMIKAGDCKFTIYEYFDEKHNKNCYSIRFVDGKKGKKK